MPSEPSSRPAAARNQALRREYLGRIHRVVDHVEAHLGEELALEELARVAAFSPFHFHRVFTSLMGETVQAFVRRLRLEKAAFRLVHNPALTVTEAALDCGFSSSATFARAFKEHFGCSATEWRDDESKQRKAFRNPGQTHGKQGKAGPDADSYPPEREDGEGPSEERSLDMEIEVKELPTRRVAYIRELGPYAESAERAWNALCRWAGPRGLLGPHAMMIGVSYDDPDVTAPAKLRYDACVTVGDQVRAEREVNTSELAAGKYAVIHFDGRLDQLHDTYRAFHAQWLPESGYQPGDAPSYEVYLGEKRPDGSMPVDICIPIKPL